MKLDIPRHRQATFEPQLVAKYQRRLLGFDHHVISMYARGMSAREQAASAASINESGTDYLYRVDLRLCQADERTAMPPVPSAIIDRTRRALTASPFKVLIKMIRLWRV